MSAALSAAPSFASVRLQIPGALYLHLEAHACAAGLEVEEYIVQHIARTREFTSEEPIYLTDQQARRVRQLLGGRVNTPEKLVAMIERLTRMKVAGQTVVISPARQEAMTWWARSAQLKLEDAMPQMLDQALGLLLKC